MSTFPNTDVIAALTALTVSRWFSGINNQGTTWEAPGSKPGRPTDGISEEAFMARFTRPMVIDSVDNSNSHSIWVIETDGLSEVALAYLQAATKVKHVGWFNNDNGPKNDLEVALHLARIKGEEELQRIGTTTSNGTEFILARTGEMEFSIEEAVRGLYLRGLDLAGQKEADGKCSPVADMTTTPRQRWGEKYLEHFQMNPGGMPVITGSKAHQTAISAGWTNPYR